MFPESPLDVHMIIHVASPLPVLIIPILIAEKLENADKYEKKSPTLPRFRDNAFNTLVSFRIVFCRQQNYIKFRPTKKKKSDHTLRTI